MATKSKSKSALPAVVRIQSLSKTRFTSTVKKSSSASEVLRFLGIYENGRNIQAVRERASSEKLRFAK